MFQVLARAAGLVIGVAPAPSPRTGERHPGSASTLDDILVPIVDPPSLARPSMPVPRDITRRPVSAPVWPTTDLRRLGTAPWREPARSYRSVVVATYEVPTEWLRWVERPRMAIPISRTDPAIAAADPATQGSEPAAAVIHAPRSRHVPRRTRGAVDPTRVPTRDQLWRVATLVFGLVLSLVAVEAAARIGRR